MSLGHRPQPRSFLFWQTQHNPGSESLTWGYWENWMKSMCTLFIEECIAVRIHLQILNQMSIVWYLKHKIPKGHLNGRKFQIDMKNIEWEILISWFVWSKDKTLPNYYTLTTPPQKKIPVHCRSLSLTVKLGHSNFVKWYRELLIRPFDKIKKTLGIGQWPKVT